MYYIYKINNSVNDKIYIGQTIQPLKNRWSSYVSETLKNKKTRPIIKAMRRYGVDKFSIEIIDTAGTIEDLDEKEIYWIKYYDSCNPKKGYNASPGGHSNNGMNSWTTEYQKEVRKKLRDDKLGGKNPAAKKVKCRNEETKEEFHFNSFSEMVDFFNEHQHNFITRRCTGETKYLYRGKWNIAYEDQNYRKLTPFKNNNRRKHILVEELETEKKKEFPSYAAAERYYGLPLKTFSGKAYLKMSPFIIKDKYKITVLN